MAPNLGFASVQIVKPRNTFGMEFMLKRLYAKYKERTFTVEPD